MDSTNKIKWFSGSSACVIRKRAQIFNVLYILVSSYNRNGFTPISKVITLPANVPDNV